MKLRDVKMIRERSEKSTEKFVNLKVDKELQTSCVRKIRKKLAKITDVNLEANSLEFWTWPAGANSHKNGEPLPGAEEVESRRRPAWATSTSSRATARGRR